MPPFPKQSFRSVFCAFNRHEPRRSAVHWDGSHFVATCCGCGKNIRRHAHKLWKEDRTEDAEAAV